MDEIEKLKGNLEETFTTMNEKLQNHQQQSQIKEMQRQYYGTMQLRQDIVRCFYLDFVKKKNVKGTTAISLNKIHQLLYLKYNLNQDWLKRFISTIPEIYSYQHKSKTYVILHRS